MAAYMQKRKHKRSEFVAQRESRKTNAWPFARPCDAKRWQPFMLALGGGRNPQLNKGRSLRDLFKQMAQRA
jgi:hypothetical protein